MKSGEAMHDCHLNIPAVNTNSGACATNNAHEKALKQERKRDE